MGMVESSMRLLQIDALRIVHEAGDWEGNRFLLFYERLCVDRGYRK